MKATDLKRILKVLLILSLILGSAHYLIFATITLSLPEDFFYTKALAILLILGWASIPTGFIVSLTGFKKKLVWLSWIGYIWMGFFHLMFFSSLTEWLIRLFVDHSHSYWVFFFSLVIGLYALSKGLRAPSVITHELNGPANLKGMSLVQISDLHIGLLHLNAKWLGKVVQQVNAQNTDFFAITGDLVEGPFAEVSPQLEILKNVQVRFEKFYITGNHEYIHGSGPWEKRLEQLGFTTLHNQNKIISYQSARVLFAGVPDRMVPRFDPHLRSQPDVALHTTEKVDYKILLAHEPASRWDIKTESCDLLLSGHTHGGQIFPFGILVRLVQPVVSGFKKIGDTLVFAHQGTGLWGPPMRWFSRCEIVVFKWK